MIFVLKTKSTFQNTFTLFDSVLIPREHKNKIDIDKKTNRHTQRNKKTNRHTQKEKDRNKQRNAETKRHTQKDTNRQIDIHKKIQTDNHKKKQRDR